MGRPEQPHIRKDKKRQHCENRNLLQVPPEQKIDSSATKQEGAPREFPMPRERRTKEEPETREPPPARSRQKGPFDRGRPPTLSARSMQRCSSRRGRAE